jgi:thioredoxin reductase (NADPH)
VAAGSTLRRLGVGGEEEFEGRGVSYCATCDGAFFADETVAVVGGGDSAMDEAITLTHYASKVILFHRGDRLDAQKALQDRVMSDPKIEVRWNTVVERILGNDQVHSVAIRDTQTGETFQVEVSGVFIFIGLDPNTEYLKDLLPLDNAGHIQTNIWMETPVSGIFAAGDIRQQSASQLVTSAGDGATAAIAAHRYISGKSWDDSNS